MPGEALDEHLPPQRTMTLDQLAAAQRVVPLVSLDDLSADLWESDAELDAFIADVRRSRHASLA